MTNDRPTTRRHLLALLGGLAGGFVTSHGAFARKGGDDGGDHGSDDNGSDDNGSDDNDGGNGSDDNDGDDNGSDDNDGGNGRGSDSLDRGRGGSVGGDEARKGVSRGEIVALPAILKSVGRVRAGTVVAVDLVATPSRRLVYEVVVVDGAGRYSRVRVDARTNRVIDVRKR